MVAVATSSPPSIDWQYSPPWQPLETPCPGCIQQRQARRIHPSLSHAQLEPGVPTKLLPNGKSTIVKMRVETIRSPSNSSVQLVYIPKGRLSSLANNGFARMVSSESRSAERPRLISSVSNFSEKQKRDHRAQALTGGVSHSNSFPMTIVAAKGNEDTAREQLQLLEAALSSPQATESKNGQLPRVFIAPSNIPPPPGYVKIPLVPQNQAENPQNSLPGTFLTHNNPRPLPPGFVRLSLPSSVSHLSKNIPLVRPDTISKSVGSTIISERKPTVDNFQTRNKDRSQNPPPPPPQFDHTRGQQSQANQLISDKREILPRNIHQQQPINEILSENLPPLGFNLPKPIRHEERPFHNSFEKLRPIQQLVTNTFNLKENNDPTTKPEEQTFTILRNSERLRSQEFINANEDPRTFVVETHTPPPRKHEGDRFPVIPNRNRFSEPQQNSPTPETIRDQFSQPFITTERSRENQFIASQELPNNRPRSFTRQTIGTQTFISGEKFKSNPSSDKNFTPLPISIDHDQILQLVKNSGRETSFERSFGNNQNKNNIKLRPEEHTQHTIVENIDARGNNPQSGIRVVSKGEPKHQENPISTIRPIQVKLAEETFENSGKIFNQNNPINSPFASFNPFNSFLAIGTPANIPFPQRNRVIDHPVPILRNQGESPILHRQKPINAFDLNQRIRNENREIIHNTNRENVANNQFQSTPQTFEQTHNPIFSAESSNSRFRGQVGFQVQGEIHPLEKDRRINQFSNERIPNHFSNSLRQQEESNSRTTNQPPRITTFSGPPIRFRQPDNILSGKIKHVTTFAPPRSFESTTFASTTINPSNFIHSTPQKSFPSVSSTSPRSFPSSARPFITSERPFTTSEPPFVSNIPNSFSSSTQSPAFETTLTPFLSTSQFPFSNEANIGPFKVQPFFNSFGVTKQFNRNEIRSETSIRTPISNTQEVKDNRDDEIQSTSSASFEPRTRLSVTSNLADSPSPKLIPGFAPPSTVSSVLPTPHNLRESSLEKLRNNNIRNSLRSVSKENTLPNISEKKIIPSPHRISTEFKIHQVEDDRASKLKVTTFKPAFKLNDPVEFATTTEHQTTIQSVITERATLFPPFSVARRRHRLNKKDDKKDTDGIDSPKKTNPSVFGRRIRPRARQRNNVDQSASGTLSKVSSSFRTTTVQPTVTKSRLRISSRIRNRSRLRQTTTTESPKIENNINAEITEETTLKPTNTADVINDSESSLQRGVTFKTILKDSQRTRPAGIRRRRPGSRRVPQWIRDRRRRLRNKLTAEASIDSSNVNDPPVNFIDNDFNVAESARVIVTQHPDNSVFENNVILKPTIDEVDFQNRDAVTKNETYISNEGESVNLEKVEDLTENTTADDTTKSSFSESDNNFSSSTTPAIRFQSEGVNRGRVAASSSSRALLPNIREYVTNIKQTTENEQTDDVTGHNTKETRNGFGKLYSFSSRRTNSQYHDDYSKIIRPSSQIHNMNDGKFDFNKELKVPFLASQQTTDKSNDMNTWDIINEQHDDVHVTTLSPSTITLDDISIFDTTASINSDDTNENSEITASPLDNSFSELNYKFDFATDKPINYYFNNNDDVFSLSEPEDSVGIDSGNLEIAYPQNDYAFGESLTHVVYAVAPSEVVQEHTTNSDSSSSSSSSSDTSIHSRQNNNVFTTVSESFRTVADGFKKAEETKKPVIISSKDTEELTSNSPVDEPFVVTAVPIVSDSTVSPTESTTEMTLDDPALNVLGHSTVLEIRSSKPKVCFPDGRCVFTSDLKRPEQ